MNYFVEKVFHPFCEKYRSSVFLQLDMEIMGIQTQVNNDFDFADVNYNTQTTEYVCEAPETFDLLPKNGNSKRSKGSACIELLQQIKSLTFLCNEDVLGTLEDQLRDALKYLEKEVDTDAGLVSTSSYELKTCGTRLQQELTSAVLKNGCHTATVLDLLTLEVTHSKEQSDKIRKEDRLFKTGWLNDEIINSFMFLLESQYSNVLFCPSSEALLIAVGKSFRLLWKGLDLATKTQIIVPFNPTNTHWILLFIDIKSSTLFILDPMMVRASETNMTFKKSYSLAVNILSKKFGATNITVGHKNHALQEDGMSCGVLTCYYAECLVKGADLTKKCNATEYRRYIFQNISGSCLKGVISDKNKCKGCNKNEDSEWIQCGRCKQWCHCKCVGTTYQVAKSLYFYCKF